MEKRDARDSVKGKDRPVDDRPTHSEDGVDLTLIRWMLSLTPAERLEVLQGFVNAVMKVRQGRTDPIPTPGASPC